MLQAAGVILNLNNQVYLKAEEVADMVMAMLPGKGYTSHCTCTCNTHGRHK